MSGLVYRYRTLFLIGGYFRPFFQTADNSVNSIDKILSSDSLVVMTGGYKSSFITYIRYFSTGESRSLTREKFDVNAVVFLNFAEMDIENRHAVIQVR